MASTVQMTGMVPTVGGNNGGGASQTPGTNPGATTNSAAGLAAPGTFVLAVAAAFMLM
jgi:hypothetical protein